MAECERTGIEEAWCAHCRTPEKVTTRVAVGQVITARFNSRCASCGLPVREGDSVGHSDEADGWVGMDCCGDPL